MSGQQFEVMQPDFRGDTDATDHLVLWGHADNIEQVNEKYPNAQVVPLFIPIPPYAVDFDLRVSP